MNKHRVLLVDDHDLFRKGLAALLSAHQGFEVIGEARDGLSAISMADVLAPDVVLMDIQMPKCGGVEAARRIREKHKDIRIVMLTAIYDEDTVLEALKNGADGYLLKTLRPEQLYLKLEGIMKGESSIPGSLTQRILGELRKPVELAAAQAPESEVSPRDREVLALIAEGLSNREIGERLNITENTVKLHVKNILERLNLDNRVQAAVYAVRQGIAKG